ncbi:hypothetical protein [Flavobacterium sp.]|jgi:hypothetical protein|uniref:hypothetical protein n=1 Tax=Flavobacterium sp. TaxID=239 RepID=UPI0037C13EB4
MLFINLYLVVTYIASFEIANKKANNGDGWDVELFITSLLFPLALPILILAGIYNYLTEKSSF